MPDALVFVLKEADALIAYAPLSDEQEFASFLQENNISKSGISVLADRESDPTSFANLLTKRFLGKRIALLIPGREFDASGTRHGRGGGWYDRFLSKVPRDWVRVGILKSAQFSEKPLTREAWDEPMDWLLIQDGSEWKALKI